MDRSSTTKEYRNSVIDGAFSEDLGPVAYSEDVYNNLITNSHTVNSFDATIHEETPRIKN